jgi:ribosome-associated protein
VTASPEAINHAGIAARAAAEKFGEDINVLDVTERLPLADCFVLVTGDNERMVNSIVDDIEEKLSEAGLKPLMREGQRDGRWVLLDYGTIMIHVLRREERGYYDLDRLYRDCPTVDVDGVEQPDRGAWASAAGPVTDLDSGDLVDVLHAESVDDLPLAGPAPDADEL